MPNATDKKLPLAEAVTAGVKEFESADPVSALLIRRHAARGLDLLAMESLGSGPKLQALLDRTENEAMAADIVKYIVQYGLQMAVNILKP